MSKPISLVIFYSTILIVILNFFVPSYAEEPKEAGFSGYFVIGGNYIWGEPSLDNALSLGNWKSDNRHAENQLITSLYQSPNDISELIPMVSGGLSYTFASTDTTLSLGEGGPGLFSITQPLDGKGIFSLGYNYMEFEVWQDPFIVGVNRIETDLEINEVILSWDNIMNSGINISYALSDMDIENDVAGNRNQYLKRDGKHHTIRGGLQLYETDIQEMYSSIIFDRADITGKSFSYDGYGVEFVHVLKGQKWDFETGISFVSHKYDQVHPEFNKKREDNIYSLQCTYKLNNPLGFKNYFIVLFGSYSHDNSNINFYDETLFTTSAGIGYAF